MITMRIDAQPRTTYVGTILTALTTAAGTTECITNTTIDRRRRLIINIANRLAMKDDSPFIHATVPTTDCADSTAAYVNVGTDSITMNASISNTI